MSRTIRSPYTDSVASGVVKSARHSRGRDDENSSLHIFAVLAVFPLPWPNLVHSSRRPSGHDEYQQCGNTSHDNHSKRRDGEQQLHSWVNL